MVTQYNQFLFQIFLKPTVWMNINICQLINKILIYQSAVIIIKEKKREELK